MKLTFQMRGSKGYASGLHLVFIPPLTLRTCLYLLSVYLERLWKTSSCLVERDMSYNTGIDGWCSGHNKCRAYFFKVCICVFLCECCYRLSVHLSMNTHARFEAKHSDILIGRAKCEYLACEYLAFLCAWIFLTLVLVIYTIGPALRKQSQVDCNSRYLDYIPQPFFNITTNKKPYNYNLTL